jgi:hypothetical protein
MGRLPLRSRNEFSRSCPGAHHGRKTEAGHDSDEAVGQTHGTAPPGFVKEKEDTSLEEAVPPTHHYVRHVSHGAAYHRKMAPVTGDTANQLNQEELARLQAGSSAPPPAMANP